jgi:hypothetical protein
MSVPRLPRWLLPPEQGIGLVVEGDGRARRRVPATRAERAAEAAALEHPECTVRRVWRECARVVRAARCADRDRHHANGELLRTAAQRPEHAARISNGGEWTVARSARGQR